MAMALDKLSITPGGIAAWAPASTDASQGNVKSRFIVGSVTGSIDDDFESNTTLDLYEVQGDLLGLIKVNSIKTSSAFTCLDTARVDGKDYVLTGNDMGECSLIPFDVFESEEDHASSIKTMAFNSFPIISVNFNPMNPHKFAVTYEDGTVFIAEISKMDTPEKFTPRPTATPSQIVSFAWNFRVEHIFSTAFSNGTVYIWNMKEKKLAMTLRTNVEITSSAWNPNAGKMVGVTSKSAGRPLAAMWDLQSRVPLMEFSTDNKIASSISWCQRDPRFFATVSSDGGFFWSIGDNSKKPCPTCLASFPPADTVSWNPVDPTLLLLTSAAETRVFHCVDIRGPRDHFASSEQYPRAPEWIRPICHGPRLVQGSISRVVDLHSSEQQMSKPIVEVLHASTCPTLVEKASILAEKFRGGIEPVLEHFIQADEEESEMRKHWELMKAFASPQKRIALRNFLGFDASAADAEYEEEYEEGEEEYEEAEEEKRRGGNGSAVLHTGQSGQEGEKTPSAEKDDVDFFDHIGEGEEEEEGEKKRESSPTKTEEAKPTEQSHGQNVGDEEEQYEDEEEEEFMDIDTKDLFSLMLCGKIDRCIDRLLDSGEVALALIFASRLSHDTFKATEERVMDEYIDKSNASLIALIRAVSSETELVNFIRRYAETDSKMALAALLTYVPPTNLTTIAREIAKAAQDEEGKTVARLLAGEVNEVFEEWAQNIGNDVDKVLEFTALCKTACSIFGQFISPNNLTQLHSLLLAEGAEDLIPILLDQRYAQRRQQLPHINHTSSQPRFDGSTESQISPQIVTSTNPVTTPVPIQHTSPSPVPMPTMPVPPSSIQRTIQPGQQAQAQTISSPAYPSMAGPATIPPGISVPPVPTPVQHQPTPMAVPPPSSSSAPSMTPASVRPQTVSLTTPPTMAAQYNSTPGSSALYSKSPVAQSPRQSVEQMAAQDPTGTCSALLAIIRDHQVTSDKRSTKDYVEQHVTDLIRDVINGSVEFRDFVSSVIPLIQTGRASEILQRANAFGDSHFDQRSIIQRHTILFRLMGQLMSA